MMNRTIAERYVIYEEIGAGGMGKVYKGLDTRTNELIAIKQLKSQVAQPEIIERFRREGEALRDLNHPNIVKLLDAVQEDDSYYLVLEFISGGDLNDLLAEATLPVERVVKIAIDLADALTRTHKLDIIHRDLKPANVLIGDDGTLRLTDFGVARIASEVRVTDTEGIIGTLDYLSPEALQGQDIDSRADIWAFGAILFEMLTGQRPFVGADPGSVIAAILYEPVPDLEDLRDDAPISLVDLIYRMLEKDPQSRIASVRHVGAALEDILQGHDISPMPALRSDIRFATPTSEVLAKPKHNLTQQTTPFVGRKAEIEEVTRLLADSDLRLITILGPGGMGKTRLSEEVARRDLERFNDGTYLVELAPLSDEMQIVPAVAQATNYQFQQDERDQKQQLLDYLGSKQMLLIMDNFEHLLTGASLVTDILKHTSNLQIIVTSRQKLGQSGETVFNLEGMDFPQWKVPEDALEYAAAKLFMQSAKRVRPDFELEADDLPYVAQISRLVHGVPLGILLAAAWLSMLSLQEIAEEIQKSLDFLEGEMGDLPDRHRSIRAVFDYSWDLMNESERDAFMKLSVFKGGFTREAAQAVTGANLRTLMTLMNKSLLRRDVQSGRYESHELLRQYAQERLTQSDQPGTIYDSHSTYYLDFMNKRTAALKDTQQQTALSEIDHELENVRAAWGRAIDTRKEETISNTLESLAIYYQLRHFYQEGETVFAEAAQVLAPHSRNLAAHLLAYQSGFVYHLTQYERAQEIALASLADLRESGDKKALAVALHAAGGTLYVLGNIEEGLKCLEESKVISQELGDLWNVARTLYDIVYAQARKGDHAASGQARKERLAIAEQLAIPSLKADALAEVGIAHVWQGDFDTAKAYCQESLAINEKIGNQAGIAYAHYAHSIIFMWGGEAEEAERTARKGLALFNSLHVQWGIAWSQLLLGSALSKLGQYDEAQSYLQQALASFKAANNQFPIAYTLANMAFLEHLRGADHRARQLSHEALQIASDSQSTPAILAGLHITSLLQLAQGAKERAVEQFMLILEHPASMPVDRTAAAENLALLEAELPPDTFAAAQQRGKALDLKVIVQDMLADFSDETGL